VGEAVLQVLADAGQLLDTTLILQFAVEQLLLSGLEVGGGLIESLAHVLAQRRLGLLQQGIERRVGRWLAIADLTEHQQGQFTGNGAALHQALLEGRGE
jgi:hypothetical protein